MEMEQDKKKRGREGDQNQEEKDVSNSKRHAKKQDGLGSGIMEDYKDDEDHHHKTTSEESNLADGVFDFPWLKDGVVWKSEEWRFEDVFSSPLDETSSTTSTITTSAGFEFSFSGQCLCQSPEALLDFPEEEEDKFEETESVDCIWSSLLNQPLQHPN